MLLQENIKEENIITFKRMPAHIGIIPDGNRRWALNNSFNKQDGYSHGIEPGFRLYELMIKYGVKEATFYGFTKDNTGRPAEQIKSYTKACVDAVNVLAGRDANLLVIGDCESKFFPEELKCFANKRVNFGKGLINLNFLVNYDWGWDLSGAQSGLKDKRKNIKTSIHSRDISRIDLIIRWGGRMRLSGFLPVQSVYSDVYLVDEYWPDFKEKHFVDALSWYQDCDVTLGG